MDGRRHHLLNDAWLNILLNGSHKLVFRMHETGVMALHPYFDSSLLCFPVFVKTTGGRAGGTLDNIDFGHHR